MQGCGLLDLGSGVGDLMGDDDGGAVLDDAGLLVSDLGDRGAQPTLMLAPDGGNDGDVGADDVRGVPSPAQAHLDDGHVDGIVGEGGQSHDGQDLEEGQARPTGGLGALVDHGDVRGHVLPGGDEPFLTDRFTVEADALTDGGQMRGGEATGAHAAGGQKALGHTGGGGLAVGAGDVNGTVGALGVAQEIKDGLDPFQGGLDLVLGSARENLGLDLAHTGRDLDAAGSGLQVSQVLALGVVGKLGLPRVPVIGVVGVGLGKELREAVGVTAGDHVGGDELTQSLKVLTVLSLGVGLLLSTGPLKIGDGDAQPLGRIWGARGLQVGQEIGVDTGLTEDGVDDLLPRGTLGDAEGGAGTGLLGVVVCGHCAILYSTWRAGQRLSHVLPPRPNLAEAPGRTAPLPWTPTGRRPTG